MFFERNFGCSASKTAARNFYVVEADSRSLALFISFHIWVKPNLANQDAHIQYITMWMRSMRVHPHLESTAVTSAHCDAKKCEHKVTLTSHFKFKSAVSRGLQGLTPTSDLLQLQGRVGARTPSVVNGHPPQRLMTSTGGSPTGVTLLMLHPLGFSVWLTNLPSVLVKYSKLQKKSDSKLLMDPLIYVIVDAGLQNLDCVFLQSLARTRTWSVKFETYTLMPQRFPVSDIHMLSQLFFSLCWILQKKTSHM